MGDVSLFCFFSSSVSLFVFLFQHAWYELIYDRHLIVLLQPPLHPGKPRVGERCLQGEEEESNVKHQTPKRSNLTRYKRSTSCFFLYLPVWLNRSSVTGKAPRINQRAMYEVCTSALEDVVCRKKRKATYETNWKREKHRRTDACCLNLSS